MVYAALRRPIVVKSFDGNASYSIKVHPAAISYGETSSIFKGRIESSSRSDAVALKVFRRSGQGPTVNEIFRRELRALRRIDHPFVVPVLGAAEQGDLLIIATRWAPNGNLLQYLRAHRSANRQMLLFQVAIAVAYLHTSLRVVHGDLKCENVLVSEDGKAVLTDFGLSTAIDKLATETTTRTELRQWNTLRFAAPELLFDAARSNTGRLRSKTPATDVYAFGMLVVQAFSGRKPWPAHDGLGLFVLLLDPPIHPRPACPDQFGLTEIWWQVCLACWRRDPADRPEMLGVRDILAESLLIGGPAASNSTVVLESKPIGGVSQGAVVARRPRTAPTEPAASEKDSRVELLEVSRTQRIIVVKVILCLGCADLFSTFTATE